MGTRVNKFDAIKRFDTKNIDISSRQTSDEASESDSGVYIEGSGAGDVKIDTINLGSFNTGIMRNLLLIIVIVVQVFAFALIYRNYRRILSITKLV